MRQPLYSLNSFTVKLRQSHTPFACHGKIPFATVRNLQIHFVQTKRRDIIVAAIQIQFGNKGKAVLFVESPRRKVCGHHVYANSLCIATLCFFQTKIQHFFRYTLTVELRVSGKGMYHKVSTVRDIFAPTCFLIGSLRISVQHKSTRQPALPSTKELRFLRRCPRNGMVRGILLIFPARIIYVPNKVQHHFIVEAANFVKRFACTFCNHNRIISHFGENYNVKGVDAGFTELLLYKFGIFYIISV